MPDVRGWWLVCGALSCAAAPPLPASTPPLVIPPVRSEPTVSYGWEPLRPVHPANLRMPTVRDAAACDAAAEAASAAGVVDVALYWRAEAHTFEPTPARAVALTAARIEAGIGDPVGVTTALAPDLADALRTAVENHAWDELLALALPALADQPHHELYFWAGDALWQQGHEVAARRMWGRARGLLRVADVPLRPRTPLSLELTQMGWTADGLAFARRESKPWLEVWDDRLERPWRRWQVARADKFAWSSTAIATVDSATLTLHDPASGATLATTTALGEPILRIVAASQAPVFAVTATSGAVKVWRGSPGLPLEAVLTLASTGKSPQLALDPPGTRLAIQPRDRPVQIITLTSGAARRVDLPDHAWSALHLVDERTLLLADDAGGLTRVRLAEGADEVMTLRAAETQPKLTLVAAAATRELAVFDTFRTALATCGEFLDDCRDRLVDHEAVRTLLRPGRSVLRPNTGEVRFAPDGRRLAISHRRGLIVHDLTTASITTIAAPSDPHHRIAGIANDGATLVVEGERGLAVWDTRTGEQRLARDHRGFLGYSPDGERVAIRADKPPRVEVATLTADEPRMLPVGELLPHVVRFSPDGRRIAIAAGERIGVWDAVTGAELWSELRPERVHSLEFTVRDELVYATGEWVAVRDAAGDGVPRLIVRREDGHATWSVSPSGADLLFCANDEIGAILLDLRTRRVRRKLRNVCNAMFLAEDSALFVDDTHPGVVDLRTGRRTLGSHSISDTLMLTNGRAVVARALGEWNSLAVLSRDGTLLATLRPRSGLGWYALTPEGAIDGDPAALTSLDAEVGRGLLQRYPAALVWDSIHVPDLVPRVLAGEHVVPPVPR